MVIPKATNEKNKINLISSKFILCFFLIKNKKINVKIKKLIVGVNAKKKFINNAKNEAKIAPTNVVSKKF